MLGICTHWLRGCSGDGPPHEFVLTDPEAVPATALEDDSTALEDDSSVNEMIPLHSKMILLSTR